MKDFLHPFKHFYKLMKKNKMSKDQKRNLRVLIIACILNLSFAAEKFFLSIDDPLSDSFWFVVYGSLGIYLAVLAIHDYVVDVHDETDNDKGERNTI